MDIGNCDLPGVVGAYIDTGSVGTELCQKQSGKLPAGEDQNQGADQPAER